MPSVFESSKNNTQGLNSTRSNPGNNSVKTPEKCPICKSDTYVNPSLEILISACYHKLCLSCVNRIFVSGTGLCPTCKQTQSKSSYKKQTFDDLSVEKECDIRSRLNKIYNLHLEDFNSLDEYNDYLEQIEDLVFMLMDKNKKPEAELLIKKYQKENSQLIKKNELRLMNEQRIIDIHLEKMNRQKEQLDEFFETQDKKEDEHRLKQKEKMLEELSKNSSKSADQIIFENKIKTEKSKENKNSEQTQNMQNTNNTNFPNSLNTNNNLSTWDQLSYYYNNNPYRNNHNDIDNTLVENEHMDIVFGDDYIEPKDYINNNGFEFYDPVSKPLIDENIARVGGYSLNYAYQKSIEALYMGLYINLDEKLESNNKDKDSESIISNDDALEI